MFDKISLKNFDHPLKEGVNMINKKGKKYYIYHNPNDIYPYRILSVELNPTIYFKKRLKIAKNFREKVLRYDKFYRWINSEGDMLSGIVIDRFEDIASLEITNKYYLENLEEIIKILKEFSINTIYLFDKKLKRIEGNREDITYEESGVKYYIEFEKAQKTGFFFDQRENRKYFGKIAYGKVLDVFSYTGGFGLHALKNEKVEHVTFIEKNRKAIEILIKNLEINNISENRYEIIKGNAFKVLKKMINNNEKFDCIILDPPALFKGKIEKRKAIKSYYVINKLALGLIDSGILVTSSCSYKLNRNLFLEVIKKAAGDMEREISIFRFSGQAPDHLVNPYHPETEYLKVIWLKVDQLRK